MAGVALFQFNGGPHLGDGKGFGDETVGCGAFDIAVVGGEEDVGLMVETEVGQERAGPAVLDRETDAVFLLIGGADRFHRLTQPARAVDRELLGWAGSRYEQ